MEKKNLQPIQERVLRGFSSFFFLLKINDFQPVKIYDKKRLKNSQRKKAWKDFEDESLLHQYCKIKRRSKPNQKKISTKKIQKSWNSHGKIIIKFEAVAHKIC